MKVTVPVLLTQGRKTDHRTKNRSAAQPQKKPVLVRCETLNPRASRRLAISVHRVQREKVSSAPRGKSALYGVRPLRLDHRKYSSSPARKLHMSPAWKRDRLASQISIAHADHRCTRPNQAAAQPGGNLAPRSSEQALNSFGIN